MNLTAGFSEVFDTYKPDSLKGMTTQKAPIQYKIADDTNIPLTWLLSHEKTKVDLTDYLAKAILDYKLS